MSRSAPGPVCFFVQTRYCIFFGNKRHMNEVRFSNIFIEKRTSCFLKALQLQGFFYLRSFNALVKKRKC